MLTIRLQRLGKSKQPSYRLIVSEKRKDPHARHVEILGIYNPVTQPKRIDLNVERVKHWLLVGAQPSPTVHNLLLAQGIISGKRMRSVHVSNRRRAGKSKA